MVLAGKVAEDQAVMAEEEGLLASESGQELLVPFPYHYCASQDRSSQTS